MRRPATLRQSMFMSVQRIGPRIPSPNLNTLLPEKLEQSRTSRTSISLVEGTYDNVVVPAS